MHGFDVHFWFDAGEDADAFLLLPLQVTFRMTQIGQDLSEFVDDNIVVAHRRSRLAKRLSGVSRR